jgi:TIR domain-containing protein
MKHWLPMSASFFAGLILCSILFYYVNPRIVKWRLLRRRLGKVFASYSHKDEEEVNLVGQVVKSLGGDFLRDRTHISGGENWREKLNQLIDEADTFQLFWSKNAIESTEVEAEWKYALNLERENFICPVFWENKLEFPPELAHLQFIYVPLDMANHKASLGLVSPSEAIKRLPPLIIILFIVLAGSVMAATFWGVSKAIKSDEPPAAQSPTEPIPVAVAPNNRMPKPTIKAIAPRSAMAGSRELTLRVTGTDFIESSVVQWNGKNLQTAFVSNAELTAMISDSDVAVPGKAKVTVFNQPLIDSDGGASAPDIFTINRPPESPLPPPSIQTLAPDSAIERTSGFNLRILGSNFNASSVAQWNGKNLQTTFISDAELTATILDQNIQTPGRAAVTVYTPPVNGMGGGASTAITFEIKPSPLAIISSEEELSNDVRVMSLSITNRSQDEVTSIKIMHTLIGPAEFIDRNLAPYSDGSTFNRAQIRWNINKLAPGQSSSKVSISYKFIRKQGDRETLHGKVKTDWEYTVQK